MSLLGKHSTADYQIGAYITDARHLFQIVALDDHGQLMLEDCETDAIQVRPISDVVKTPWRPVRSPAHA